MQLRNAADPEPGRLALLDRCVYVALNERAAIARCGRTIMSGVLMLHYPNMTRRPMIDMVRFFVLALVLLTGSPSYAQIPLPDTSAYVEADNARLFFRAVGEGVPLVVLHGGPGLSHGYLAPQLIRLLADDYRLIFYDQRASGRSTGVTDTTRLTMDQFVEDLDAVRRAFGLEQMNLLGHSFGGLLAMHYAAAHPARVERLILLDTDAASWELRTPYQQAVIAARETEEDRREMKAIEVQQGAMNDPAAMARLFRIGLRTYFYDRALADSLALEFDEHALSNYHATSRLVRQDLGRYDIHDRLERITAPTLLLHGEASIFSVEGAAAIAERIPAARLIVLNDVGHFAYIEAPRAFEAALKAFVW